MLTAPAALTDQQIEEIEKQTLRWVVQALFDYAPEIWIEFRDSPDEPDGVAEDVTQESLSRLSGYNLDKRRLYGTVDYRRARYAIFPELIARQALFVDSKAEKSASAGSLQINQSSLRIAFARTSGTVVDIPGALGQTITLTSDGMTYLTTTVFVHYHYSDGPRTLKAIKVASLPNGRLEADYVTGVADTIWRSGRDSPKLGEKQRARLSFARLKAKRNWRVQTITFDAAGVPTLAWDN